MQGLTNRALRAYFIEHVRPDVIFTEFKRVNTAPAGTGLSVADQRDIASEEEGVPLVVQLVGHGRQALVLAARAAQEAGAAHINLNMGCPYGRMGGGLTGGGMLRCPDDLAEVIPALRDAIDGSFSVKIRAGYNDPDQILSLLPLFESSGVDFLVLHPRTVVQKYDGAADHGVTTRVVRGTRLPVIANGDIRSAADGGRVLGETGAAGLMLGRGAIADPALFLRLRGQVNREMGREERRTEVGRYLREMLVRYGRMFGDDTTVLNNVKEIIAYLDEPELSITRKELLRAKTVRVFEAALHGLC
jgi:tRNA-dihydrouridine synthase